MLSPVITGSQKFNLRNQPMYPDMSSTPRLAMILVRTGGPDQGTWAILLILAGKENKHMCVWWWRRRCWYLLNYSTIGSHVEVT